jgi:subtilisin family serine protease
MAEIQRDIDDAVGIGQRGRTGYNTGTNADGDAAGLFTDSFGGTSSACPGAAGVVALVLSVNPALEWNEVTRADRRQGAGFRAGGAAGHW